MPITDILILCLVIAAFVSFAVLLAWGDGQTRAIAKASRQRALESAHVEALKRKTESGGARSQATEKDKAHVAV